MTWRVVIQGDGVAASALACCLAGRGFDVVMIGRPSPSPGLAPPTIEALPEATVRMLAEVGLGRALDEAGAVVVRGFENRYDKAGRVLEGMWAHVDRAGLARACRREARREGAVLAAMGAAPSGLAWANVDATGRSARWSRPVARYGAAVATLYAGPGRSSSRPGRIVGTDGGWAYRLDHPDGTTVGVVSRHPAGAALDGQLGEALDVDGPGAFVRVGSRPASVQWSECCVGEGRLAIGDAALAYSPLAGQGLRFAVASALAASAVLESWREGDTTAAAEYYRAFVDGARRRHLAKLAALDVGGAGARHAPDGRHGADGVRFAARVERVGLNVGGRIVTDEACVLPDGGVVRWVGGFDLLALRDCTDVATALAASGMSDRTGQALVDWALRAGVLAPAPATAPG